MTQTNNWSPISRGGAMSSDLGPSRWYYVFAALVLVGGTVVAVVGPVMGAIRSAKAVARIVAPGEADFSLDDAGAFVVFYEHRSVVGGQAFSTGADLPADLTCTISRRPAGEEILIRAHTDTTITAGSLEARSLWAFDAPEAGTYRIAARYADGRAQPRIVLSVRRSLFTMMGNIFLAIGILIVTVIAAFLIALITLLRRLRARQTAARQEA